VEETSEIIVDGLPAKGMRLRAEHKVQWVKRFRESGLSLRKFSAQYGLRVSSLCSWCNREREGKLASSREMFVEVKLPGLGLEQPRWVAELDLGNGKALRISADVPEGMLEQLLGVC
jgi:hypothetical protein